MTDHANRINRLRHRRDTRQFWVMVAVIAAMILLCLPAHAADARLMLNIMTCESGMRHSAVGDDGVSRGIAQFRKDTFYEFAAIAIKRREWNYKRLGKPHWLNPVQQVFLLEWGLDNGYADRWACYRTRSMK
ncbi:MAG: hypothetical protein WC736_14755 [Gallionella sp.]|jgi:hypothetical protein